MRVRDVEGGEAGTSAASTGAKRTPEQARRRAKECGLGKPARPNNIKKESRSRGENSFHTHLKTLLL